MPTNPSSHSKAFHVFRALRPNQWTKNIVVLAAFVFAFGDETQTLSAQSIKVASLAFGLFCLISSGVYLFNDIKDIESDRLHPIKKFRPLASGAISTLMAAFLSFILLAGGLAGAYFLSPPFGYIAATYVAMQIVYTLCRYYCLLFHLHPMARNNAQIWNTSCIPDNPLCHFWNFQISGLGLSQGSRRASRKSAIK